MWTTEKFKNKKLHFVIIDIKFKDKLRLLLGKDVVFNDIGELKHYDKTCTSVIIR